MCVRSYWWRTADHWTSLWGKEGFPDHGSKAWERQPPSWCHGRSHRPSGGHFLRERREQVIIKNAHDRKVFLNNNNSNTVSTRTQWVIMYLFQKSSWCHWLPAGIQIHEIFLDVGGLHVKERQTVRKKRNRQWRTDALNALINPFGKKLPHSGNKTYFSWT